MCEYMEKMDALSCLSDGVWRLPPDAVLSAMHCVVRPSDLRAHRRNPNVPYPVRVVTDLTGSGVNDCFAKWRFRIGGATAAVGRPSAQRGLRLQSFGCSFV